MECSSTILKLNRFLTGFIMLFIVISLFSEIVCVSQSFTWQRTLNNRSGSIWKVQQTSEGGYISFGSDFVNNSNYLWETWLQKYDPLGDTVWKKVFNERGFLCTWGQQTADKGYILCGYINDDSSFSSDVYLLKTDSLGNRQWGKVIYEGNDIDQGYCVKQTSDGGYIVIARIENVNSDVGVFKTDSNGIIIWNKIFIDNTKSDFPSEILELTSGYIIVGTSIFQPFVTEMLLMRLNSIGDSVWTRNIGGGSFEDGSSIDLALGGGFILGGTSGSYNSNSFPETYVVKTDTSGNIEWYKTFSGFRYDNLYSIRRKLGIGYIMAGFGDSTDNLERAKIRLIDQSGNLLYQKSYMPGNDENMLRSIELTSDGGFISAGHSKSIQSNNKMYIVKMDSLLNANPIGISEYQTEIPEAFVFHQNYPNPFNPQTKLGFDIPLQSSVSLVIYDILGREVEQLVNETLRAGKYSVSFRAYNLPSGIYFAKLSASSGHNIYSKTQKMVLLK
jgi:Secretion system C-terminal sorting domain